MNLRKREGRKERRGSEGRKERRKEGKKGE